MKIILPAEAIERMKRDLNEPDDSPLTHEELFAQWIVYESMAGRLPPLQG